MPQVDLPSFRRFFKKEPKFSVWIALAAVILLLAFFSYTNFYATATRNPARNAWVAQQSQPQLADDQAVAKQPQQPHRTCRIQQTITVWQETYFVPVD